MRFGHDNIVDPSRTHEFRSERSRLLRVANDPQVRQVGHGYDIISVLQLHFHRAVILQHMRPKLGDLGDNRSPFFVKRLELGVRQII